VTLGLASWLNTKFIPIVSTYSETLNNTVIAFIDDEDTDLRRIRETETGNQEKFPVLVACREPGFKTTMHPRVSNDFYKAYAKNVNGINYKFDYLPVQTIYRVRYYATTFESCEEFISRLYLYYTPQSAVPYTTGNAVLDTAEFHMKAVIDLESIKTKVANKHERQEKGSINVVTFDIKVNCLIISDPVAANNLIINPTATANVTNGVGGNSNGGTVSAAGKPKLIQILAYNEHKGNYHGIT
jgi:hypothetical protein